MTTKEIINFAALFFPGEIGAQNNKVSIKSFHKEILDTINANTYVNITGFRGCAKSTWAAYLYPLAAIVLDKEPYTIIARETKDLAREAFDAFSEALETIREAMNIDIKTAGELTLSITHISEQKTSKIRFLTREKKIRGARAKGGSRPTLIILDDIESYETVESKLERERTKRFVYGEVLKAFDAKRIKFINIGNYIHQDSVVVNLENDQRFKTVKIPVFEDDKSVWEDRFSTSMLKEEYESYKGNGLGNLWLMEMMCQIIDEENATFKRSDFVYIPKEEALTLSRYTYTLCDLALTQNARSDYTAFVTVGLSEANDIFILDITAGKWSAKTDKIGRELYSLYEREKPIRIGIENKAGVEGFFFVLDTLAKENGSYLPLDEIKASNVPDAKFKRISALQPLFRAKKIHFCKELEFLSELENELLTFPRGAHDDIIDALSYLQNYTFKRDMSKNQIEIHQKRRRPW